jgi:hypothetical protein
MIISTRSHLQDWRVSGNRTTWEKSNPKDRRVPAMTAKITITKISVS